MQCPFVPSQERLRYMHLIHRRFIRVVCLALCLAGVLTFVAPSSNAAEWEQELTGIVTPNRLITHTDSKVTVAACSGSNSDALRVKTFSASGPIGYTNEVPNTLTPKLYGCIGQSAVGGDGTFYAVGVYEGQDAERLIAHKDNAFVWNARLPSSCRSIYSMAVGAERNIYVVAGNGCEDSLYRLIGFRPQMRSGASEPDVVLNTPVNAQFGGVAEDALAAHTSGLIVQLRDGVQFFPYDGSSTTVIQPDRFARSHEGAITASANGRVFYPVLAPDFQLSLCGARDVMARVDGRTQTGADWTYTLPGCSRVDYLRSTPDGGVVIDTRRHNAFGVDEGRWLVAIDGRGAERWSTQIETPNQDMVTAAHSITTTLAGDVLVYGDYNLRSSDTVNERRVGITLLSSSTGEAVANKQFAAEAHGFGFAADTTYPAVANDRVYVALRQCRFNSCGGGATLYAVDVPGAKLDYPRGEVVRGS